MNTIKGYKKGPNGTLRAYDRYGKFCKEDLQIKYGKIKKTYLEKISMLKENLINSAKNSKDPGLYNFFLKIEKERPGLIKNVNIQLFNKKTRKYNEIDIVTKNHLIEFKSGVPYHRLKQQLIQIELAKLYGKKHILYAEKIPKHLKNVMLSKGATIITDFNELLKEI